MWGHCSNSAVGHRQLGLPAQFGPGSPDGRLRTAARLDVPWPAAVAETTKSHYEGKTFPLARSTEKQPLPVFPELLEKLARSWKDRPYSGRSAIQRCAIHAMGKALSTLVFQECAQWLNLANLLDREKDNILDRLIVPEGIFDSSLASMQRRCKAKKKEDEALQLCLSRKPPVHSQPP